MAIVKSLINWGMLSSSHFVQCNSMYIECTYVSTMLHRIDSFYIFKWFQLYWRVAYFRKKCPLYYLAKEREDAAEKLFHTREKLFHTRTWSLTPQDGASAAALPGCNWNWRRRIIWKSCKNLSMLGLCICKITKMFFLLSIKVIVFEKLSALNVLVYTNYISLNATTTRAPFMRQNYTSQMLV